MATTDEKAAKYLAEGRVKAQHVGAGTALFHVQGSEPGDPYFVKFSKSGWRCDCPARVSECAHVKACMLVTELVASAEPSAGFVRDPDIDALLS